MILIYLAGGFIFLIAFLNVYNSWQDKKSCKEEVIGKITKKEEYKDFNNNTCYWLTFSYIYKEKEYENYVLDKVTKNQINDFSESKEYKLFVNPENPDKIRLDKKILTLKDFTIMIFSGIMLIGLAILILQWINLYIFS